MPLRLYGERQNTLLKSLEMIYIHSEWGLILCFLGMSYKLALGTYAMVCPQPATYGDVVEAKAQPAEEYAGKRQGECHGPHAIQLGDGDEIAGKTDVGIKEVHQGKGTA